MTSSMRLQPWQATAFASPCVEAEHCAQARFFRRMKHGQLICSVGFTLNVGLE